MPFPANHEEFMQAVHNHLKEREGCAVLILVHTAMGLEIQGNFMDFALQMGMCRSAAISTDLAFENQIRDGFKSGDNKIMVSMIQDAINPKKKRMN